MKRISEWLDLAAYVILFLVALIVWGAAVVFLRILLWAMGALNWCARVR